MTDTVVASLGPRCGDNDGRNQRGEPCARRYCQMLWIAV